MTSAALDRLLAVLVVALAATGLVSLRMGAPGDGWLFAAHGMLGGALALAVVRKVGRSLPNALRARRWGRLGLGLAVSLATASALVGGFAWVAGGRMTSLGSWTILTIHAWIGLTLVPMILVHLLPRRWRLLVPRTHPSTGARPAERARPGRRVSRRQLVMGAAFGVGSMALFGAAEIANWINGGSRQFTGSRWLPAGIPPPTTFYGEGAPQVDPATWQVRVHGKVPGEIRLSMEDVAALGLETAATWIGWTPGEEAQRQGTKVRAKGLSCIIKGTATPSTSTAVAKLNDDGSLDILMSSVEMGQGVLSAMAILGSEPLGLSVDRVSVSAVDTDLTPYDQQTSSSRSTYAMGAAVQGAVNEVRRKALQEAADLLEASVDDLELVDGRVRVMGVPGRSLDLGAIVRRGRSGNIVGEGTYRSRGGLDPETGQGLGSVHWHQAAGAAEVEVDTETGKVTLLRYHAGVYAGRIINPVMAELQTEGNVAFGVGQALFEEMVFDNGQLQNGNLGDYMISSIHDQPHELNLQILENLPAAVIHGIGESSLPPVMPAIGNAIARATGVRIVDLPITPEKILRGLRASAAASDTAGSDAAGSGTESAPPA